MKLNNDLLFDIFMTMLVVSTLLGVATWGLIFVLSFYFRKLDKSLLISPYFNEAEQKKSQRIPTKPIQDTDLYKFTFFPKNDRKAFQRSFD